MGKIFEVIFFLYSWLPPPLNILATGALGFVLVVAIVRLVAFLWELLPFT